MVIESCKSRQKFKKWLLLKGSLGSFDEKTRDLQVFDWIEGNSTQTCPLLEKLPDGSGGFVRYPAECEKFIGDGDEKVKLRADDSRDRRIKGALDNDCDHVGRFALSNQYWDGGATSFAKNVPPHGISKYAVFKFDSNVELTRTWSPFRVTSLTPLHDLKKDHLWKLEFHPKTTEMAILPG